MTSFEESLERSLYRGYNVLKILKFSLHHCIMRSSLSAVKNLGTKREHSFLIPKLVNKVRRVPLLTFINAVSSLVVIFFSFFRDFVIFSSISTGLPGLFPTKTDVLPL